MATAAARNLSCSRKLVLVLREAVKSDSFKQGHRTIHSSSWTCSPVEPSGGRQLNVGIMGSGRIATSVHLGNILSNRRLRLKWITEDNPEQAARVKTSMRLDDVPFLTSKDTPELLSSKDLDAVFVFTPTNSHCHYVCESLSKGKAVFVEKPAGQNFTEIKTCFEHSERFGKPLVTAFHRRFDPPYQNVVLATRQKHLGDIHMMIMTTRDSPRPSYDFLKTCDKSGCNILSDLTVHDIDMMVWITQAERPESIYVQTHTHDKEMAKFGEADTLMALIKYRNGILATVDSSRYAPYGYDIRLEIFGSKGKASVENPRASTDVFDSEAGSKSQKLHESFGQRFRESYINEINHFIDCVEGKTQPLITKEESLMTAEIIEKGHESFHLKKPVYF